jgi:hypothetical protein
MSNVDELITINDLARKCGYFNGETVVNNGYGCDNPSQEETDFDDEANKDQGKCYSWGCPLAYEADYEDIKRLDPDLAKEYAEQQQKYGFIESDWVVMKGVE